ncbi:type II secretion system protein [Amycolatopsis sp. SID8362]|uniref:type II secretion system protein n=1 Tax=Amycolatopsis sp. SID8362 TaxID=2690346 RepID=UPI0013716DDA|nr:type II secretion system protein [Amycolatopsis sp. SID8362]NBH02882.1 type II secretion system protein [Amycolatopsis sp. SID8362]NED39583.1 type II secretion system protein [Amycolatopsis sp. SID8362]
MTVLILLAVTAAIGGTLVVAGFAPTRPRLADVLHEPPRGADFVMMQADRLKLVAKPADLALVGRSRESFVVQRVGFLLGGALWIPALTTVLALIGAAPPIVLTGAASVGCALVGWQLPVMLLKSKVKHARTTFTGALAAYCRLVALGRLGDRGPVEALRYPATLGDGWAFRRIKLAIDEAVLRGRMPWAGFVELAEETGVRELKDIGHIIASAGQDGASIVDTLRAKAAALDEKQLADRKTGASVRSDRMDMPVALLGLAFIVFLAFPGLYLMLHT